MRLREALAAFRGHHVPRIDFIGRAKWWFALSGVLVALSLVGLAGPGLNFSIAFEGGAQLQFPNESGATVADYQAIMARFGRTQAQVEILGDNEVSIRTESLTGLGLRADQLREAVARQAGIPSTQINEQDVGPTWGATISRKAVTGLLVFLVLVSLYISFRFEPKMAAGALAALLHDLLITAGVYALVGREVTPETVIAVLTIMGYSLYDSVVIFDKIKENTESPALVARETYSGVVNLSLNQVAMRSVNTSMTTLFPVGALLLFGGQTLKDFAFALFVGIAIGTYSSLFVAAPVLALLKEREPRYRQIRTRLQQREARPGLRAVGAPGEAGPGRPRELEPAAVRRAAERSSPGRPVPGERAEPGGDGAAPARPVGAGSPKGGSAAKKKRKPQGKAKRRRR